MQSAPWRAGWTGYRSGESLLRRGQMPVSRRRDLSPHRLDPRRAPTTRKPNQNEPNTATRAEQHKQTTRGNPRKLFAEIGKSLHSRSRGRISLGLLLSSFSPSCSFPFLPLFICFLFLFLFADVVPSGDPIAYVCCVCVYRGSRTWAANARLSDGCCLASAIYRLVSRTVVFPRIGSLRRVAVPVLAKFSFVLFSFRFLFFF